MIRRPPAIDGTVVRCAYRFRQRVIAAPGAGARVDKTLFTINDVAEVFLAIRIHADGRVNE